VIGSCFFRLILAVSLSGNELDFYRMPLRTHSGLRRSARLSASTYNEHSMQIYLINLDRDHKRLAHFQRQAEHAGVVFQRVAAVDGRKLSPQDFQKLISPAFEFSPMTPPEVGCLASHKKAWERLLATDAQHAAIFEDDAILSEDLGSTLSEIAQSNLDFDIIKLETTLRRVVVSKSEVTLPGGYQLQQLLTWHGGTAGYIISRAGAEKLLGWKVKSASSSAADRDAPLLCSASALDQMLFNPFSKVCSQLRILQLNPAACIQNDILARQVGGANFGSTIQPASRKTKFLRYGVRIGLIRLTRKLREKAYLRRMARQIMNTETTIEFQHDAATALGQPSPENTGRSNRDSKAA
jgi:glycosyl transferase, family 25